MIETNKKKMCFKNPDICRLKTIKLIDLNWIMVRSLLCYFHTIFIDVIFFTVYTLYRVHIDLFLFHEDLSILTSIFIKQQKANSLKNNS